MLVVQPSSLSVLPSSTATASSQNNKKATRVQHIRDLVFFPPKQGINSSTSDPLTAIHEGNLEKNAMNKVFVKEHCVLEGSPELKNSNQEGNPLNGIIVAL